MITPRRHPALRRAWMLITVACIGLVGLVPVTPAEAQAAPERPVLLVGGTFTATAYLDNNVKPWLEGLGYDVYTAELATWENLPPGAEDTIDDIARTYGYLPEELSAAGTGSMDPEMTASGELVGSTLNVDQAVDEVLNETGAPRVDIIAHSQAGPVVRWYLKWLGGSSQVAGVVSVGGGEAGFPPPLLSRSWLLDLLIQFGCAVYPDAPVCADKDGSSPFFQQLNAAPKVPAGVDYFHLWGSDDKPPIGWTFPGATSRDVSSMCAIIPGVRPYTLWHVDELVDPVMRNVIQAALERRPLTRDVC